MRVSSIDIGTNTVLLLVADIDNEGTIHPLAHEQRFPRLGRSVDRSLAIQDSAFSEVVTVLREYQEISAQFGNSVLVVSATSAVRDASNRNDFVAWIRRQTGIQVEVLDGEEEALWTYRGALSGFRDHRQETAVLDIGGGSTELSFPNPHSHNGHPELQRYSLQLGAVRLTERFFRHDPPVSAEIESAQSFILEEFAPIRNPGFHRYDLIGVAGTVTTLACLDQNLEEFRVETVSGYRISKAHVADWTSRLQSMRSDQIRAMSRATWGRADILTGGVMILSVLMSHFGFEYVLVSERGLRYGMVIREWEKSREPPR